MHVCSRAPSWSRYCTIYIQQIRPGGQEQNSQATQQHSHPIKTLITPSTAVNNLQKCISDLESWLYKWKININTDDSNAVIFTKGGKSRKQAKNIRTRNSMIGRGTLLVMHPERIFTCKAHINAVENNGMRRFVSLCAIFNFRTLNRKKKSSIQSSNPLLYVAWSSRTGLCCHKQHEETASHSEGNSPEYL
jgi:hypothetical protein